MEEGRSKRGGGEEEEGRREGGRGEEKRRKGVKKATPSAMFVHIQVSISPSHSSPHPSHPPFLPPSSPLPTLTSISHDLDPDTRASSKEEPWSSQHRPAEEVKVDHQTDEEERKDLCVCVCLWGRGGGGG